MEEQLRRVPVCESPVLCIARSVLNIAATRAARPLTTKSDVSDSDGDECIPQLYIWHTGGYLPSMVYSGSVGSRILRGNLSQKREYSISHWMHARDLYSSK